MSGGITSTVRLAISSLSPAFDRRRINVVVETIEQALYDGGVYASADADSCIIEITVRSDQLLDTAKVLTELELL